MRLFASVVGLILLTACTAVPLTSTTAPGPGTPPTTPPQNESYSGGLRTLFVAVPEERRYKEGEYPASYQVAPGDSLRGQIGLINEFPDTKQVLILLLLNYLQSDFAADTNGFDASYAVTLKPGEEARLTIQTRPLSEGYYDLAWVFVIDPNNLQTDLTSRIRTTFTPIYRGSLYVGNGSVPPLHLTTFNNVTPDPSFNHPDSFYLVPSPDSFLVLAEEQAHVGESINLFVRFGVPKYELINDEQEIAVALVGFWDNRQIKLNSQDAIYGVAKRGYVTTIPLSLQMPGTAGSHQFFIHRFPHPFTPVTNYGRIQPPFDSLSTQRLVIHVSK